jgi:haloacetate dehalogenase
MLDSWADPGAVFTNEVRQNYIDKFSVPTTIHAICEQYRAAATLDYGHDEEDRGTKKIAAPVLALWSASGPVAAWYDPIKVWKQWADDVTGGPIDSGHFLPEEAPRETVVRLLEFFAQRPTGQR